MVRAGMKQSLSAELQKDRAPGARRPGQPELLEAGLTPQPGSRWPRGAGRPAARTRKALGSTGEGPVRDGSPRLCPRLGPWQPASPPSQQVEETPEHGLAASPRGCTGPGGRAQKLPPSPPPRPAPAVGLLCRTAVPGLCGLHPSSDPPSHSERRASAEPNGAVPGRGRAGDGQRGSPPTPAGAEGGVWGVRRARPSPS